MTDPRTIAAGLTAAQRAVLLGSLRHWKRASYSQVLANLRRKSLILSMPCGGFELTPLSLAVRTILQEQHHAK